MKITSIRWRLIIVLSSLLILAFVSTNLISYFVSKDRIRAGALDETLPLISNNILSDIQNDLMMPIHVSSLMSNDTFLKDWALAGETDMRTIQKYLKEIKEKYGFFTSFFVSEATGRYYYYDGILKTISPGDAHDVWYYDFKKMNVDVALDVDTDEASAGTLTVFINHRLRDYNGRFLGVTGVGLNMEHVGQIVAEYWKKYDRMVFMVDSKGVIQLHPDKSLILKKNISEMEGLSAITPDILKNKAVLATYEVDRAGRHVLLAARYFPRFDWFLIVEQEEGESLSDIRSVMITNLAVGLLVTLLIMIIVVLVVNFFQRRLERLAAVDELTNVANRRSFMESLQTETARTVRYSRELCLLMIDVDHFKDINDRYGHATGDKVLASLAGTIKKNLRDTDLLGRLGGEEFGVILPETDPEEGLGAADRIRAAVERTAVETDRGPIRVTVSIGVADSRHCSGDMEKMMSNADWAMYQAKNAGRNRVLVCDSSVSDLAPGNSKAGD